MSVLRKFAGQTLIYGLSTIVARLINSLFTPIFVSQFSTAVYGVYTLLYSWAAMIQAVLAFGMETTFFRFLQKHDDKARVLNNTFFVILIISICFLSAVFSWSTNIATWLNNGLYDRDYVLYVRLFALFLVADALAVVPFAQLRAQGRPIRFGVLKFMNVCMLLSTNLFLLFGIPWLLVHVPAVSPYFGWYRPGWLGYVFIANLAASVLVLLLLLPELMQVRLRPNRALLLEMLAYSFPILIANISYIINEHLDKLVIPKLIPGEQGISDNGIYGAVSKLAIFLSIAIQAFRLGAEPFFFSYAKNENARKVYAIIMDYFIIATVLAMVAISANIEWLKYFIKGKDAEQQALYWSGLHIVPILLLGYVLLGIYMNLSVWYKLTDQTRFGLYISGVGAIVTILLDFILIPRYSYQGAVWVTVIAYGIMVFLSYVWGQRRYPIPYRLSKNLLYIFSGVALCLLIFNVFDRHLIISNLLFMAFAAITFFRERKELASLLKK